MCENKTEGCYFGNGELCRHMYCHEREKALQELTQESQQLRTES